MVALDSVEDMVNERGLAHAGATGYTYGSSASGRNGQKLFCETGNFVLPTDQWPSLRRRPDGQAGDAEAPQHILTDWPLGWIAAQEGSAQIVEFRGNGRVKERRNERLIAAFAWDSKKLSA